MKPMIAQLFDTTEDKDRRVVLEVGPPGRDGVDVLVVDPYGAMYWTAASSIEIVGPATDNDLFTEKATDRDIGNYIAATTGDEVWMAKD